LIFKDFPTLPNWEGTIFQSWGTTGVVAAAGGSITSAQALEYVKTKGLNSWTTQ
jgi:hypothetical protein